MKENMPSSEFLLSTFPEFSLPAKTCVNPSLSGTKSVNKVTKFTFKHYLINLKNQIINMVIKGFT